MLIKRGAEASLYLETLHNRKVIKKKRHKKNYRLPELDKEIQNQRTRRESQMIHKAKEAGVSTPVIYLVDLDEATIIMEYIEGKTIKYFFDNMDIRNILRLCEYMGRLIGKLHNYGIIHGDLTTSNMILTTRDHRIVFVDFGLSEQTIELEARGVDLNLMKKAFKTIHFKRGEKYFKSLIKGYRKEMGIKVTKEVLEKIIEIEKRGRYISER